MDEQKQPLQQPQVAPSEPEERVKVTKNKRKDPQRLIRSAFSLLHDLCYVLGYVAIVFIFIFRLVTVDGRSMLQTLYHGDYVALQGSIWCQENYQCGDIVVAVPPNFADGRYPIVKRVIAVAGQTVDIDFVRGIVYVDGVALEEDYINTPTNRKADVSFPVTVPQGCVFLMGDNRNDSKDSRDSEIGMVDTRYILGKVLAVALPADNGNGRDWDRWGVLD